MIAAPRRRLGPGFWGFILVMLALTGVFAWLGVWQLQRLAEKEALIAQVSRQLTQPPVALPAAGQWGTADADSFAWRPVTTTGHYVEGGTVFVFTSLSEARGRYGGPGYWVMAPFAPAGGGTVFINRGFVPQEALDGMRAAPPPAGPQTVTGIALAPQAAGLFTPAPDTANRIDWVRDPARLAALAGIAGPVFGLTLDAPAGEAGALPQGGETVVTFSNKHLGYALTWFGFALLTPGLLAFWIWRQLRPAAG